MGLIKAIGQAVGSTMRDQWLDLIKCDNMDNDTLMVKQTTKSGQISKGSRIIVAPGQAVVIYDSGSILDASAEEGVYTFDQSSSPSFFGGQFGPVFKEMWQRFTYGGTPAKEQAVFFFNLKEIMNNKFGTASPITFNDWDHPTLNIKGEYDPLYISMRCNGIFSYKLDDLALFMRNYAGNANIIKKDVLHEQLRTEVVGSLEGILGSLSNRENPIGFLKLTDSHTKDEIKKLLEEDVYDASMRARGIRLVTLTIASMTPDEESKQYLKDSQTGQGNLARGRIIGAVNTAAANTGGAGQAFVGMGMMGGAMGGFGNLIPDTPTPQQPAQAAAPQVQGVPCPKCGTPITGKFCPECGTPAPAPKVPKKCPKCGTETTGKFCPECGTPVPDAQGPKHCTNCGAEVTGKFCPECGTPVA